MRLKNVWLVSGIYIVRNTINEKVYTGSSSNLSSRISMHKRQLLNNIHCNSHLQSSYNKYGKDFFKFDVVTRCKKENLLTEEEKYIKMFNCLNPKFGYNKASNIRRTAGYKWTKESREKLSNSKKGSKMHPNTLKALIDANKKRVYKSGFKMLEATVVKIAEANKIQIHQYTLEGDFVKSWKSAVDAAKELGIKANNINACVRGEKLSYKKFQWSYKKEISINKRMPKITKLPEFRVEQYKNNELINSFASGREAANKTGFKYKGILGACKNNKPYMNFNWEYYKIEP